MTREEASHRVVYMIVRARELAVRAQVLVDGAADLLAAAGDPYLQGCGSSASPAVETAGVLIDHLTSLVEEVLEGGEEDDEE